MFFLRDCMSSGLLTHEIDQFRSPGTRWSLKGHCPWSALVRVIPWPIARARPGSVPKRFGQLLSKWRRSASICWWLWVFYDFWQKQAKQELDTSPSVFVSVFFCVFPFFLFIWLWLSKIHKGNNTFSVTTEVGSCSRDAPHVRRVPLRAINLSSYCSPHLLFPSLPVGLTTSLLIAGQASHSEGRNVTDCFIEAFAILHFFPHHSFAAFSQCSWQRGRAPQPIIFWHSIGSMAGSEEAHPPLQGW